ncbi:MAG: hypothetical protein AAGC86_09420 [Pseudomonadota bacterium]
MVPGRFNAYSAGSQPEAALNPHTIDLLKSRDHEVRSLRSKNWDEFAEPKAHADIVITVGGATAETCPVWP